MLPAKLKNHSKFSAIGLESFELDYKASLSLNTFFLRNRFGFFESFFMFLFLKKHAVFTSVSQNDKKIAYVLNGQKGLSILWHSQKTIDRADITGINLEKIIYNLFCRREARKALWGCLQKFCHFMSLCLSYMLTRQYLLHWGFHFQMAYMYNLFQF